MWALLHDSKKRDGRWSERMPTKLAQKRAKRNEPTTVLEKVLATTGLKIKDSNKRIPLTPGKHKWVPPRPMTALHYAPQPSKRPVDVVQANFKAMLRDDLIGFIGQAKPKFRVVTSGGYGLKTLLETKHNLFGKVNTKDLDLTVSTRGATMTPKRAYSHWMDRINKFLQAQQDPQKFMVKPINFDGKYNSVIGMHRYYVITLTYDGDDFVDVAFTDLPITDAMIERTASVKAGIPLKKEEEYLKEFMAMAYMENVPGVEDYLYEKRNPITGKFAEKGVKDIKRSQLICKITPRNKYVKYCKLLQGVTKGALQAMPKAKRDSYFRPIKGFLKTS